MRNADIFVIYLCVMQFKISSYCFFSHNRHSSPTDQPATNVQGDGVRGRGVRGVKRVLGLFDG